MKKIIAAILIITSSFTLSAQDLNLKKPFISNIGGVISTNKDNQGLIGRFDFSLEHKRIISSAYILFKGHISQGSYEQKGNQFDDNRQIGILTGYSVIKKKWLNLNIQTGICHVEASWLGNQIGRDTYCGTGRQGNGAIFEFQRYECFGVPVAMTSRFYTCDYIAITASYLKTFQKHKDETLTFGIAFGDFSGRN